MMPAASTYFLGWGCCIPLLLLLLFLCPLRAAATADPGKSADGSNKGEWELQAKAQGKNDAASNVQVLKELGVEIKSEGM